MTLSGRGAGFGPVGAQALALGKVRRLKHPFFLHHKLLEGHAGDLEVLADVGDFDGVWPDAFHCYNGALHNKSFSDEKRIGMVAAITDFLLAESFVVRSVT